MKTKQLHILCLFAILLMYTGCASHKNIQKTPIEKGVTELYPQKVISNYQTAQAVTAKMKLRLVAGDKDLSLSGNLKMKRNDVIQLSLSFLGMEVGRMEFSKDNVLILDRVHRQYARVPYAQIDFLQSANLDFNCLQALFWNELFVPGQPQTSQALSQFSVAESGDHTLLSLKSAPKLNYAFLTVTQTALLTRTTVSPKNAPDTDNLECRYADFVKLSGHSFPSTIKISFKGGKTYTLDMQLSSLNNSTEWQAHTEVSSKYSPMNINSLLNKLVMP